MTWQPPIGHLAGSLQKTEVAVANWRQYTNTAVADTLAVTINTAVTSMYAGSGAPVGYPVFPGPSWILTLEPGTSNSEMVLVTAGAGTAASPWTITRAPATAGDGGTAKSHTAGVAIQHTMSANDLTTAATHEQAGSGGAPVHNLPAAAWLTGTFLTFQETLTTAAQASVSMPSIPQTATHLLVTAQGRLAEATVLSDDVSIQFNGDAGAHYSYMAQYATTAPVQPSVPATTVAAQNTNPYPVQVVITGGTLTVVAINGITVGTTAGTYYLSPGNQIAITYSSAPTWVWTMADPSVNAGYALTSAPLFRFMASLAGATANVGGGFAFIPNYTSSSFNKMAYCVSGGGNGTSSFSDMRTRIVCWNPAAQAAITSISLIAPAGGFNLNCQLGLYGVG